MIPNVYVVGSVKCATTSLYNALKEHSNVSLRDKKESTYFLKGYHLGSDYLSEQYKENEVCVDFHPSNCLVSYVPHRIRETAGPGAKIVLIIREPIARAYSDCAHFHGMRPGREYPPDVAMMHNLMNVDQDPYLLEKDYMLQADPKGGFYDRRYFERGCYISHIRRFYMFVNLEIFFFEDIIENGSQEQKRLAEFIGVPHLNMEKSNSKTQGRKFIPHLEHDLRIRYEAYNQELSDYLKIDVGEKWYA